MRATGILSAPGLHASAYYAALFAALGVHLPFWPLWLADWGLSAAEVGAFTAAGLAVRVLAGVTLPALADRMGRRRAMLGALGGFGALAFLAHVAVGDRAVLFVATLATSAVFAGLVPVGDALGAAASRAFVFDYARARAVGSLAFLLANLGLGAAIGAQGPGVALWALVLFLTLAGVLGATHPGGGRGAQAAPAARGEVRRLLSAPRFLLFTAAIGLAQASHGIYYAYGSLHWRSLGIGEAEIGALWAFGVGVEIVLMAGFGGALVRAVGPAGAIALSAAVGVLRWTAMAFDPSGPLLWAVQGTHAVTFAAGHLGAVAFIARETPERLAGAAQGLYGAAAGGALVAVATGIAAVVYPIAGSGTYLVGAAMAAGGLACALRLRRGAPIEMA